MAKISRTTGADKQVIGRCPKPADAGNQTMAEKTLSTEAAHPLLWLFRRKGKDGHSLIGPASFAAGERLRADMVFSGQLPKTTMDWSGHGFVDISRTSAGLNPTEAVLAARQRVDQAMRAVGPEFAGLLMDLCVFSKGLETIEIERGWPQRSGKVVIQLALAALARHYGFDDVATGRTGQRIRSWLPDESRPRMRTAAR